MLFQSLLKKVAGPLKKVVIPLGKKNGCRALDGEMEFGGNARPRDTIVGLTIGLVATIAEALRSAEADDIFFPPFQTFSFSEFLNTPKP